MKSTDLVWWALTVRIPEIDVRIGQDRLSRVLATLAFYANSDGVAWPSADRLARDLDLDRRTVRSALTALESVSVIARVAVPHVRSTAWTFAPVQAGDLAGIPAAPGLIHTAGMPAGHVAGDVAGDMAGNLAGIPAPKGREGNYKKGSRETVSTMVTVQPNNHCDPGHHRLLPDGTCMHCDIRAEDAA